jgi:hypothetical protein
MYLYHVVLIVQKKVIMGAVAQQRKTTVVSPIQAAMAQSPYACTL